MRTIRTTGLAGLTACLLLWSATARSDDAEGDLRRAAKLQKNGETPTAVAIWQRWAEHGNADAAYNLAVVHQYGDGLPRDVGEALRWYRRAAALGDRISEYQIGLMYQNGDGVPVDQEEAQRWFTGHRRHHAHHEDSEQMRAWRQEPSP